MHERLEALLFTTILFAIAIGFWITAQPPSRASPNVTWYSKHSCTVSQKGEHPYQNISLNCGKISVSIDLESGQLIDSNIYVREDRHEPPPVDQQPIEPFPFAPDDPGQVF